MNAVSLPVAQVAVQIAGIEINQVKFPAVRPAGQHDQIARVAVDCRTAEMTLQMCKGAELRHPPCNVIVDARIEGGDSGFWPGWF
jgi:hypothetical protein